MNIQPSTKIVRELLPQLILGLLILLFFAVRLLQIQAPSIPDFDTQSIISGLRGNRPWQSFSDIAHPGGLGVILLILHHFVSYFIYPADLWALLTSSILCINVATLYAICRRLRFSYLLTFLLLVTYLSSPIISDLSARGEENLIFHAPFLCFLYCGQEYLRTNRARYVGILGLISPVIATLHFQPFVICQISFCIALLMLHWTELNLSNVTKRALLPIFLVCGPGCAFLLISVLSGRLSTPNYPSMYYSIFNNGSPFLYCKAFFFFLQYYLASGSGDFTYVSEGVSPQSGIYLWGIVVFTVVVYLARKGTLSGVCSVVALAFVFLYEPSSSERWDTVLLSCLLLIGSWGNCRSVSRSALYCRGILISIVILVQSTKQYNQFTIARESFQKRGPAGQIFASCPTIYATDVGHYLDINTKAPLCSKIILAEKELILSAGDLVSTPMENVQLNEKLSLVAPINDIADLYLVSKGNGAEPGVH